MAKLKSKYLKYLWLDIWNLNFLGFLNKWNPPKNQFIFDLQLHAAEDEGRTEPAGERRRREEREKGNVPKSQELSSAIVLIASSIILFLLGEYTIRHSAKIMRKYFLSFIGRESTFQSEELLVLIKDASYDIFLLLAPLLGITFLFGIIGNVLQVGLLFAPRAAEFRLERLRPNFKRILPTRQTLFNLIKSILKVVLIGWISYFIVAQDFLRILLTGDMGLLQALSLISFTGFKIFIIIGLLLLVIAIADYYYQKYEYEENLKQTPSEAKREIKEEYGDVALMARRRQIMRDIIQSNMLKSVPQADVVVTNPIHFAVALQFRPGIDMAPRVIAKGQDYLALKIKEIANKNNIPIVEDRLLAQQLYKLVEVGEEIPRNLYLAVSVVFRNLEKFRSYVGVK